MTAAISAPAVALERLRRANLFRGLWNDLARRLAIRCASLLAVGSEDQARVLARRFVAATHRRGKAHARMLRYGRLASRKVGGA